METNREREGDHSPKENGYRERDTLYELYIERGLTQPEIGERFDVSSTMSENDNTESHTETGVAQGDEVTIEFTGEVRKVFPDGSVAVDLESGLKIFPPERVQ